MIRDLDSHFSCLIVRPAETVWRVDNVDKMSHNSANNSSSGRIGSTKSNSSGNNDNKSTRTVTMSLSSTAMAQALSNQPWSTLGQDVDGCGGPTSATSDREMIVDQISSVFEYRLDALVASRASSASSAAGGKSRTSSISGTTASVELRSYVSRIASMYRDVRYHSLEHAAHVTLSLNKMIGMLVEERTVQKDNPSSDATPSQEFNEASLDESKLPFSRASSLPENTNRTGRVGRRSGHRSSFGTSSATHVAAAAAAAASSPNLRRHSSTFGIGTDPMIHVALIFSALVHDVDHQGVPNRQLVEECDPLALLYNDRSVAEQHSLNVALSILMEPNFAELRRVMIPTSDDKFRFRRIVIDMLMCTDISSPERVRIGTSKWQEAFERRVSSVSTYESGGEGGGHTTRADHKRRRHSVECYSQESADEQEDATSSGGGSKNLAIKRALLFDGSTVDPYPPPSTENEDENDALKACVVLEQMLQTADVAHTMQSWTNFIKWNQRLYEELYEAHKNGRGDDPTENWYRGQITFYDCYVLPLARRLVRCGVFGSNGDTFLTLAEENRRLWEEEGESLSRRMVEMVQNPIKNR